jgi:hypothetical protein
MKNPIRRSRKIGKTQGGRVKDGRANEKWSRIFPEDVWMRLSESNHCLRWRKLLGLLIGPLTLLACAPSVISSE